MIKVGIIGCGDITRTKYLQAFGEVEGVKVESVCDINEDRAQEICRLSGAGSWFYDYREMITKADIDAVLIATPHPFHVDAAILAAQNGKHIIVEKPLGVHRKGVEQILEAVEKEKVKCIALPFLPGEAFYMCKNMILEGVLGEIVNIQGMSVTAGPPPAPWYISHQAGVGSLANIGIYSLCTVVGLIENVDKVTAISSKSTEKVRMRDGNDYPLEQEDNSRILLEWGNGRLASIDCGWYQGEGLNRITVRGRKGIAILDGWRSGTLLYAPNQNGESTSTYQKYPSTYFLDKKYYILNWDYSLGKPAIEYLVCAIKEDWDLTFMLEVTRKSMDIIFQAYENMLPINRK